MNEADLVFLRMAINLSRQAREHGNHPFGALLAAGDGRAVLQAENTVNTERDCTCHAEMNLVRLAARRYARDELAGMTLYTSTEPCPMCSGAIYWSGIKRVVFALSALSLYQLTASRSGMNLPRSHVILDAGAVEVCGPALEDEAIGPHRGFWSAPERE